MMQVIFIFDRKCGNGSGGTAVCTAAAPSRRVTSRLRLFRHAVQGSIKSRADSQIRNDIVAAILAFHHGWQVLQMGYAVVSDVISFSVF